MTSKFQNEIQSLVDNKVITLDIAERINSFYASQNENKTSRLFTIFGVLGSLLVGLGLILILAHNWDNFSKSIKTTFSFLPLIIGQVFVGYSVFKNKSVTWRESSGTFLFFAFGASIALISQIYNIPGDLSGFLLTWTLVSIPMIYLLRSNVVLLLCLIFATYYACSYGYGYMSNTPWFYLVMLVLLLPQYFMLLKLKKNSNATSIFNWLFPLSLIIVFGTFIKGSFGLVLLMYILLFGVFYNLGKLSFFCNQKLRRNGYIIFGSLGTVITILISSFNWIWEDFFRGDYNFSIQEIVISILMFLLALVLIYFSTFTKKKKDFSLFQIVFIIFSGLFFINFTNVFITGALINVLLLVLGVNTVIIGAKKIHFGVLNYGLLIITSLISCRFFDTDMSFVLRGLLFVIVGAGFFATNYILLKRQKRKAELISK